MIIRRREYSYAGSDPVFFAPLMSFDKKIDLVSGNTVNGGTYNSTLKRWVFQNDGYCDGLNLGFLVGGRWGNFTLMNQFRITDIAYGHCRTTGFGGTGSSGENALAWAINASSDTPSDWNYIPAIKVGDHWGAVTVNETGRVCRYFDGELRLTEQITDATAKITATQNSRVTVAGSQWGNGKCTSQVWNVRVYNRALSLLELQQNLIY